MIKENSHRLPVAIYKGYVTVAFTACMKNRNPLFVDSKVAMRFSEILMAEAMAHGCEVLVYLFMPDHLHVILKGNCDDAEPLKVMNRFKQKTGFWLSQNRGHVRWQKDYYDHLIRREQDIAKHVRYILNNPVRKNIITNWSDYPFKGSNIFDINHRQF